MALAHPPVAYATKPDHRHKEHRKPKAGSPIDAHVALRLKAARMAAGLSQEVAAEHINLTFQQLQKYEHGTNRISAGKLRILAELYNKPIEWFFEGAPLPELPGKPKGRPQPRDLVAEMLTTWRGPELMTNYLSLELTHQGTVAQLVAGLAGKN